MSEVTAPGILTTTQKLVLIGIATTAVLGVTVVAHRVSRCRLGLWNYGRAVAKKRPLDAGFYRAKAMRQGCDWPDRIDW